MKSVRINKEAKCPSCGAILDGATCIYSNATPSPDDLSVCIYCLHWLRFNNDLTLRTMEQEDIDDLNPKEFQQLLEITKALPVRKR